MVKVYHLKDFKHSHNLGYKAEDVAVLLAWHYFDEDGYSLVAEVNTDDFGVAFRLTNLRHHPWHENDGVTPKFEGLGCRSTSVGDIFEMDGKKFLIRPVGFLEIKGY